MNTVKKQFKNKEIDEIIETVGYIKKLRQTTERGLDVLWKYLVVFGIYIFLGSFIDIFIPLLNGYIWFILMPVVGYILNILFKEYIEGIIIWGLFTLVMLGLYLFKVDTGVSFYILLTLFILFIGFLPPSRWKDKPMPFYISAKIGFFWMIIMMLAVLLSFGFSVANVENSVGYTFIIANAIGLIVTGLFTRIKILLLGIWTFVGFSLLIMFGLSDYIILLHGITGFFMAVFSYMFIAGFKNNERA